MLLVTEHAFYFFHLHYKAHLDIEMITYNILRTPASQGDALRAIGGPQTCSWTTQHEY